MNPKDIFRPIHEATVAAYSPRHARLLQLEQAIMAFRNDALEAADLIQAIGAALKLRYENPTEVLMQLSLACRALERLDLNGEVDASDVLEAYERQVERRRD